MTEKSLTQHLHDFLDHTIFLGNTIFNDQAVTPNEISKICCAPMLIKALHKAHSINVLINETLLEESEIILRVLIEISFITGAIQKNPEFALKYGRSSYAQRFHTLKNMKKFIHQNIPNIQVPSKFLEETEANMTFYEKILKEQKIKEIKIIDYAKEAGLLNIYYGVYTVLCSSVHSGPEDLESYFSKDKNGSLLKIEPPIKQNEEIILFTAIETMIRILKSNASIFSIESEQLKKAEEVYKGVNALLWDKYNPNESFNA